MLYQKVRFFSSKVFQIDHFNRCENRCSNILTTLHGKSFCLQSVKTWNSPGFTKHSDWCLKTVWNPSGDLKMCTWMLFFSLRCSCYADASHDTRSYLSQQLEVRLVLKVEQHEKKFFMAAFRSGNLCMKKRERCFSWVYMSKWVWEFFYCENLVGWK